MGLGVQNINVYFTKKATQMRSVLGAGTVAILLEDTVGTKRDVFRWKSIEQAKEELATAEIVLTDDASLALELVFRGGETKPAEVIATCANAENFTQALDLFNSVQFEFLCCPTFAKSKGSEIKTFIDEYNKNGEAMAIVSGVKTDDRYVINFTTDNIILRFAQGEADKKCSAPVFTARIAGLLAGTPLDKSLTNTLLGDVKSIPTKTKVQNDASINAGELILLKYWEDIRLGRGVNSLTTLSDETGKLSNELQKIAIVAKMNAWKKQVKEIINERYIGKFANTVDNKMLLVTTINQFNATLAKLDIIQPEYHTDIDINAQEKWLLSQGILTGEMSEQEIRNYPTQSFVFINSAVSFTDAMEDVNIAVEY